MRCVTGDFCRMDSSTPSLTNVPVPAECVSVRGKVGASRQPERSLPNGIPGKRGSDLVKRERPLTFLIHWSEESVP